jgi:hypothetical protein
MASPSRRSFIGAPVFAKLQVPTMNIVSYKDRKIGKYQKDKFKEEINFTCRYPSS